ncbi:TPA: hypothetical protein SAN82_005413 [Pseudomonas putida]|nr:hypothetical protein [Pseudomonas putida]
MDCKALKIILMPLLYLTVQPVFSEEALPLYMKALVEGYSVGKLSVKQLNNMCLSGVRKSGEDEGVTIIRDQNLKFCNSYIAGVLELNNFLANDSDGKTSVGLSVVNNATAACGPLMSQDSALALFTKKVKESANANRQSAPDFIISEVSGCRRNLK